jgi:hypothetical protein
MNLKTATLIVIISQILCFSAQTALRFFPDFLNDLSKDQIENFFYIAYTLDKMPFILFLCVLYSKQK